MPEKVQKWRDLRQEKPCRNIGRNIENIPFRDVFFVRLGSSILAHQSIPRKYGYDRTCFCRISGKM